MGFIRWLLGEGGVRVAQWLVDNSLWFSIPIVIFAAFYKYDKQQRLKNYFASIWAKWRKTKYAIPEEDRKQIDGYKAKLNARNEKRIKGSK